MTQQPSRPRRRGLALAATATVTALSAAALAAPPATASTAVASTAPSAQAGASGPAGATTTAITLVTGDTVTYAETPDGRASATISRAARPDRVFRSVGTTDGFYVIPDDAQQFVASGMLDRELFDVKYLAHNRYGDAASANLPVIVSYGSTVSAQAVPQRAGRLAAARSVHTLPSLHAESMAVAKTGAGRFWTSLTAGATPAAATPTATPGASLAGGIRKVWLDRRVHVDLSESVPMIGAPEAWAAGYDGHGVKVAILDTGIDDTHPDLAGKVVASKSFVDGVTSVRDGHGHGTHVASTIAGSGAASGGKYRGVAPGADLVIGKVLGDDGSGLDSWIIAGMQWAATSGARVVSMSLGSGAPGDGTDPMSQAVDELTAQTGTLFVIAAGNEGPGASTVAAPGSADAALTVAAVDKSDHLADFSNRGPRLGDLAMKPDIAAPGVNIVAARAAGTSIGTPVGDRYTTLSGTSMATPHVAAAAAILAQEHPDWTAAQLKPALMGSSRDDGYTVYEQGAGRLDVARAFRQQVTTTTPNVDFGGHSVSEPAGPLGRQVTYSNLGEEPVTLELTPSLRAADGTPVPAGTLTVTPATVTVPAHGSATVDVTLDLTGLTQGTYTGAVVAGSTDGVRVTVPVGLVLQPPMHRLTVRVLGRTGEELAPQFNVAQLLRVDDTPAPPTAFAVMPVNRMPGDPNVMEGSTVLPEGAYDVATLPMWFHAGMRRIALADDPQVVLDSDTTVVIDLNRAVPIRVETPLPAEGVTDAFGWSRVTASGSNVISWVTGMATGYGWDLYAVPTETPTIGAFTLFTDHTLAAPEAELTVHGRGNVQVRPSYPTDMPAVPKLQGDRRLRLATQDDLTAGRDVRGKLVVIQPTDDDPPFDLVEAAAAAGAAGVLDHGALAPTGLMVAPERVTIPVLWLDDAQWARVRAVLAGADRPTVDVRSRPVSPYEYKLRYFDDGRVPERLERHVDARQLGQVRTDYHAQFTAVNGFGVNMDEATFVYRPQDRFGVAFAHSFAGPVSRVEYYDQTADDTLWLRQYSVVHPGDSGVADFRNVTSVRGFSTPFTGHETVNQGAAVFGQPWFGPQWDNSTAWQTTCAVCRHGDHLYVLPWMVTATTPTQWLGTAVTGQFQLFRGTERVHPETNLPGTPYPLDAGPATYTLRSVQEDGFTGQRYGRSASTDWTFTSRHSDTGDVGNPYRCLSQLAGLEGGACTWVPLIGLSYQMDLALDDTAPAGRQYGFTVTAREPQQSGAPDIAGLRLSVSYDDGAHWTDARVRANGDGTFGVRVDHPPLARTTGAVTLRAEAWDTAGNRVVQRIDRAYGLTAH